uniref:Extensin-like n=1 Tax=Ascaris lumbricoides TaxID=6252 RepID=A0A0M3ID42_ASCLU
MEEGEIMDTKETMQEIWNDESESEGRASRQGDAEEKSRVLSLTDIRNEFAKVPTQMEVCRMGANDLRRWVVKLLKLNKATSHAFNNGEAKLKTLRAVLDEEAKRIRECDRHLREHGLAASEVVLPRQTPAEASCPVLENNFSSLSIAPKLRPPEGGTNGSRDVTTSVVTTAGFEGRLPPPSFGIPPPVLSIPPPHFNVPPPNLNIPPPFLNVPAPNVAVPPPNFAAPPSRLAIPPANMNAPLPAYSTPNASLPQWRSNLK